MNKLKYFVILFFSIFFSIDVFAYNRSVIDISDLTVEKISDYLDKGIITSEELIGLYLDRINEYNGTYKAIITVNDNAMNEAKELDLLRKEGKIKGSLHGIPIIVKDNIDVLGMPTTAGAKALSDNFPLRDSDVVKKLKDQGAIILAKSNMSEFAFSASNSYSSYGYVGNAYNKNYTSYGSSGGSAVAVALDFAPLALGTDTNSSIRLPASASGLVGMRPTYGLLSSNGVIAYDINRDTVGVLSNSVKDNMLVMEILSEKKYESKIDNLEGVRIGVVNSFFRGNKGASLAANKETFGPIVNMMEERINYFEKQGATIVYLDDFYGSHEASLNNNSVSGYTMCRAFNLYVKNTTGSIRSFKQLANSGKKVSGLFGYLESCNYSEKNIKNVKQMQQELREYVNQKFLDNNLDYIIYPSTKNELYKRGEDGNLLNASKTFSSTIGYPALVVPLGYFNNLPYGLEFMAKEGEEEKLYNLALVYEKGNNYNGFVANSAPPLYEVSEDNKKLVNLFIESYENNNDEVVKWRGKVISYFRTYAKQESNENDSSRLIDEFSSISLKDKKIVEREKVEGDLRFNNDLIILLLFGIIFLIMGICYSRMN